MYWVMSTWRTVIGEMSSGNHVDSRASSKRRRILETQWPKRLIEPIQPPSKPKPALLPQRVDCLPALEPRPAQPPPANNRLLACYLAYEFLSHGTLLGRRVCPAGEETPSQAADQLPVADARRLEQVYADLSGRLLKDEGVQIPGIVNPSQLARWIGM